MPRRKRRQPKLDVEHTHLAVRVDRYDARVEAAVNRDVYAPEYAVRFDENDPLYEFTSQLVIAGTSTYPAERAGDAYDLTIYGDDAPSRRLDLKLKDTQARGEHGSPQYRSYRGKRIPVFNPPNGMGLITKIRGERRWTAWLWVAPRFVNDALVLLGHNRRVFLAIHERNKERTRWIQSVTLQTIDPEEE